MTKSLRFNPSSTDLGGQGPLAALALEASLWGGLAIILWISVAALSAPAGEERDVFAENWIALILAAAASLVALQLKWQAWRHGTKRARLQIIMAQNSLQLIDLLRAYGSRQPGGTFIFLPVPKRPCDRDAWAWLEILEAQELIGWRSWQVKATHVPAAIRQTHPELFEGDPTHFEVYRIDRRLLGEVLGGAAD